jgi:hypothetical protein
MPSPALSAARRQAEEALAYNVHNPIVLGQAVRALLAATEQRCEVHGYAPPRGCVCSCEPRPTFAATAPAPQPDPSLLGRIEAACGIPDPAQACRTVLALCREARERSALDLRIGTPAPPAGDGVREAAERLSARLNDPKMPDYDCVFPHLMEDVYALLAALDAAPKAEPVSVPYTLPDGVREAADALLEDYVGVEDMLPPETAAKVIRLRSALDGAPKPADDGVREAIRSVCSICNATLAALDAAKGGR